MAQEKEPASVSMMFQACAAPATQVTVMPLNHQYLLEEGMAALRLGERLASYNRYIGRAREYHAARGSTAEFRREVLRQADAALTDMRVLLARALRMAKHLRHSGYLDAALDTWEEAVKSAGEVRLTDLWSAIMDDETVRQTLADAGISEATLADAHALLREFPQSYEFRDGRMLIRAAGRKRAVMMKRRRYDATPGDPDTLLFADAFDAVAELFPMPETLPVDVVPEEEPESGDVDELDPLETFLASAVLAVEDMEQHVRTLDDAGLAAHAGEDPGIIAAVIIISILAFVAGTVIGALCGYKKITNETVCTIGYVLSVLGIIFLLGAGDCAGRGCRATFNFIVNGKSVPIGNVTFQ